MNSHLTIKYIPIVLYCTMSMMYGCTAAYKVVYPGEFQNIQFCRMAHADVEILSNYRWDSNFVFLRKLEQGEVDRWKWHTQSFQSAPFTVDVVRYYQADADAEYWIIGDYEDVDETSSTVHHDVEYANYD